MRNNRKSTFKDYFIEFIIVILGITIAFWLSNLGEAKKERALEAQYIVDLRSDLQKDADYLSTSIESNKRKLRLLSKAISFFQRQESNLTYDSMPTYGDLIGNYNFFEPNESTYLSLQQSGDFKVFKNKDFKKALIELYRSYDLIEREHINLAGALDDNFYPQFMSSYDFINNEIIHVDYFKTPLFRNFVGFTMNETSLLNRYYENAKTRIDRILEMTN
ncbi:hypothetical protein [Roseivirga sp. E12]|uniref:hypothetical protein n=1 Tax=Roseivirga sp. E12 TaxID=2819237 RepID=UPI001ABC33BB|nr:hypothetical protein [Roseivirga sp. E12]MBO3697825.1 hypothetical protein [Roseivirga sp. E12]